MRLAVISDIHGNLAALQAVLDDIEHREVDQIVNLGDILSGPLQPALTADLLIARNLLTIAGNHERQLLQIRARPAGAIDPATSDGYAALDITDRHAQWLRTLPAHHWLANDDLLLVHGSPSSDLMYWLETVTPDFGEHGSRGVRAASPDEVKQRLDSGSLQAAAAALVLCGHTHVPRITQCGDTLIVNPGSVGLPAYDDKHPYYHCTETGSPHARYALVERRDGHWQAQLCAVRYDWERQARWAAERGRPDWAYALATGRMPAAPTTVMP